MTPPYTHHLILWEGTNARLAWINPEHSIALFEVWGPWSWDDAFAAVYALNAAQQVGAGPYFTIMHYMNNSAVLPSGRNVIQNLRELMLQDVPQDRLVIFVSQSALLTKFLSVVTQIYGLGHIFRKYRFVPTLDEAFALIRHDQESG
jgi:hypothetical protein